MDPISRRYFLAASAGTLFAACGKKVATPPDPRRAIQLEVSTREQMLVKGPLPENVRACLAAAVGAVIRRAVDAGHYVSCFAWRAENVAGYLHEYKTFAIAADQVGAHLYSSGFAAATVEQRREILQAVTNSAHPVFNSPEFLRRNVKDFVVHEIHLIFARTDGWLALGYESWPGLPRGLDAYTRAPAQTS